MAYSETVILSGVECDYDPETHIALVYCSNCSERNEVEVFLDENGEPEYAGFVCAKCGTFNSPEG
ncbi:conserved hypothetical protein [Solidesulfovibrio fructosivorans JJ]]|uniref:Uncharacterized protein n=1 Tax=Solidesulfovibrio fructosivorans JJ] TaxID=596151 RepID=E1JZ34_SOLFR|nr:hypothetical protein [Solidesulfovibrio fructosivorans]EFL50317.1 conserved hypothetical protein [Solidesulfovibrio fructosivorans JJ]]